MTHTQTKQRAHDLMEHLAPSQVSAVVSLLEAMLDPVAYAVANAPVDDEPESHEERQAVAASQVWMKQHPGEAISLKDMLEEFSDPSGTQDTYQKLV